MNLRKLTGLACVLALSGCATYDYVGAGYGSYEGGDYYSGAPVTEYHYEGYGYPYYSYYPGISLGVRYGYPWYGRYPGECFGPTLLDAQGVASSTAAPAATDAEPLS